MKGVLDISSESSAWQGRNRTPTLSSFSCVDNDVVRLNKRRDLRFDAMNRADPEVPIAIKAAALSAHILELAVSFSRSRQTNAALTGIVFHSDRLQSMMFKQGSKTPYLRAG